MKNTKVTLVPLASDDREQFILDNQWAFKYGALQEFGKRDDHINFEGEIISRKTIERCIDAPNRETYRIVVDGQKVGGIILRIDKETHHNELEILFTIPDEHSKGIGYGAWQAVEALHPETVVWETCTPYFEKRNIHKHMNQLPKFGGDNGKWVHDRIVQVPCKRVIPQNKQDKHLVDRLLAEREGIVYRLVTALQQVIRSGYRLSEPASVRDERSRYQRANSTVITFFEDCMQPLPIGEKPRHSTVMQVYAAYQGWCRDNNRGFARTTREFREELSAHLGVDTKEMTVRHREGMVYRSHTLTQEALDYYIHGRLYSIPTGEFTAEEDEFPDFLN